MNLREIKKEVNILSSVDGNIQNFQKSWLKPIRSNTNSSLPSLKNLNDKSKKELNNHLSLFNNLLSSVKEGQTINDKLRHYTNYLIELKLNSLRGNHANSQIITNNLLNDDFLNIKQTINEIKLFDVQTRELVENYEKINSLLHRELSLEETLFFMDLPHKKYLHSLLKISQKQKMIVRHIGHNFVPLAKEAEKKVTKRKK